MNNLITHNFIEAVFLNSQPCYQHCRTVPPNKDPLFYQCLDQCNARYIRLLDFAHSTFDELRPSE